MKSLRQRVSRALRRAGNAGIALMMLALLLPGCDLSGIQPVSPMRTPKQERTGPPKASKTEMPPKNDSNALSHETSPSPHVQSSEKNQTDPPVPHALPGVGGDSEKEYALIGSFSTGEGSYVRSLLADGDTVWVGTTEGVIQVSTKTGDAVQSFTTADGLKSPSIFTMKKGPRGQYWFGTNNGGLSLFDGKAWRTYLPSDGLADFWVYGIDFASDGTAWIATWNGVSHFDGVSFKNYNTADGLADRWVYALAIDRRDGAVWFGTEGGVSRRDAQGRWQSFRHSDGLGAPNKLGLTKSENTGFGTQVDPKKEGYEHKHDLSVLDASGNETYNKNYVFSMAIDRAGNKWFGTWGGGASRFDGSTWRNFTTEQGLSGNIVYAVTVDPHDGALWFGTNHGVSRFDGKNWTSLTLKDGLANAHVYAVAIDQHKRVWLGEKGGVDVWAPRRGLE